MRTLGSEAQGARLQAERLWRSGAFCHQGWRQTLATPIHVPVKEKLLSFGPYPEVSLANARDQRDAAKALLRDGIDPALQKRIRKAVGGDVATTFEAIATGAHARRLPTWTDRHAKDVLDSFETYVPRSWANCQLTVLPHRRCWGCHINCSFGLEWAVLLRARTRLRRGSRSPVASSGQ